LVSINSAIRLSLILLLFSFLIGLTLNISFCFILFLYFFIQIIYCFYLKNIPLIEFFCIASGFIIRSTAGGIASGLFISYWFLLSIGMLSLYLAIEKRKGELINLKNKKVFTRKVLKYYNLSLINKFESLFTSCLVITYSLWAYGPIIGGAKSQWMMITIPLVILGVFRYQMLSEKPILKLKSNLKINLLESPEFVILRDKPIQIIISFWLLITLFIGLFL